MSSADLWHEKFKECRMENTTFLHPKKGCHLNFQEENDIVIYMVSFLGSLAVLPGNIISALFMDKIGRIRIIGEVSAGPLANGRLCADCARSVSACRDLFFPSRWFYVGVVCLHVPVAAKLQSRSRYMLAVSLLWRQRGGLEWTGGHFCGTLPLLQKVQSANNRCDRTVHCKKAP